MGLYCDINCAFLSLECDELALFPLFLIELNCCFPPSLCALFIVLFLLLYASML